MSTRKQALSPTQVRGSKDSIGLETHSNADALQDALAVLGTINFVPMSPVGGTQKLYVRWNWRSPPLTVCDCKTAVFLTTEILAVWTAVRDLSTQGLRTMFPCPSQLHFERPNTASEKRIREGQTGRQI